MTPSGMEPETFQLVAQCLSQEPNVDRRIILIWILRKYGSRVCGLYSSDSGHGPTASSNEHSGSTKSQEFLQ
jgi:hypothetical protein